MLKSWRIILVLLLVGTAYALRAPWLGRDNWSLDEGSTFTMAEQVRHGAVIYRDAADNRSPLVPYLKAAVFAVCGDWNAHAVHVALALMLGICAVGLWRMARRLGDETTGAAGAVFFTLLCFVLPGKEDGLAAHTEWFVIIFSILGYGLFARAQSQPAFWRGVPAGLVFGLATLCKQPGVLDLGVTIVVCALLAWSMPSRRGAVLRLVVGELVGWAVIVGAAVLYFALNGALQDLAYYAWTYNTTIYVPEVPLAERIWGIRIPFLLAASQTPVALVAGLAGASLLARRAWRGLRQRPVETPVLAWLILGWTAAGLVSTMLGGRAAAHYSIQVIPGLSLACGWATARLVDLVRAWRETHRWRRAGLIAVLAAAAVLTGLDAGRREGQLSLGDPVLKELGADVQQFSQPSEPILVWGYYPEVYFFSQRLPSTRFIYTNYLTGMIAWTNLDPLIDTHYAIVPHAWENFWADYRRHPPAVIVDTGTARGYLKYPLSGQPQLWQTVTRDFARVVEHAGQRIYRRLAPLESAALPAGAPVSDTIRLSAGETRHGEPLPVLDVEAPAGAVEIVLYRGDQAYRRLLHPPSLPCRAEFFIDRKDLWNGSTVFRVAVRDASGWRLSSPLDLVAHLQPPAKVAAGPAMEFGDERIQPVESDSLEGAPSFEYVNGARWHADAPSRIVYPHVAGMKSLDFVYGLMEGSYEGARAGRTDGVDVMVMFEYAGGGRTQLFWRRLNPAVVARDRGPQTGHVDLPAEPGGRIVLLMEPGPFNDPSFDWSYWGDLRGEGLGPLLRYGDQRLPALLYETREGKSMVAGADGRWTARAPFRIVYPLLRGMSTLLLTYGADRRAYDPTRGGGSDGIEFAIELLHADGRIESLFNRLLNPRPVEDDRKPQPLFLPLPETDADRIQIRVGVGPKSDSTDDWTYITTPRFQGPGPDIVWGGHIVVPVQSERYGGKPLTPFGEDRWGAHAPSTLVYERPPGLEAISFTYGLDPQVYGVEDKARRSDGVEVSVLFEPLNRTQRTTLFDRFINPAVIGNHRGDQHARVELPPGTPGRVIFVMGPGPNNNNSYDWCYWSNFIGAP
ncbi:MAG TPA: glycosyltransferase family 39 protein [Opitutaceae bacterium]|nr:glycosyltransferase family 39 protein [Opitutaceae bacterium]